MAPFRGYGVKVVNLAGLANILGLIAYVLLNPAQSNNILHLSVVGPSCFLLVIIVGFFVVNRLSGREKKYIQNAEPLEWQSGGRKECETLRLHFKRSFDDDKTEYAVAEVKETYETVFTIYGRRRFIYCKYFHNIYLPEGRYSLRDRTGKYEQVTQVRIIRNDRWIMYELLDSRGEAVC